MALVTSQMLSQYYELYREIDVTFTKQLARAINFLAKQTFLRFLGYQVPCIIYSSSMAGAKVLASVNKEAYQKIREANNLVSLRFSFHDPDKSTDLSFYVSGRITGFSPYNKEKPDVNFITLKYTQRPSDVLITVLGQLLEANINSKKRKEERIDINPDSMRKLGLTSREAVVFIDDVPRKGILRDISFSGASILITGVAKFLVGKSVKLKVVLDSGKETHLIPGKLLRFDEVPEKKAIGAAGIQFSEAGVPIAYKMSLNEYLTTLRRPST